jgi:hypothetical protein
VRRKRRKRVSGNVLIKLKAYALPASLLP